MSGDGQSGPSAEDLRGAPWLPGFELPDSVTMGRGVVLGDGLQPEDVGVLAWLRLRDPRRPATQEDLAREMQAHGWKMGKARFAAVFQRLKAAGHIKHSSEYNPATGRPEWRIEFFLNPANNDHYVNSGISAFPQVGAESLETGDSQTEQLFETPEIGVSRGQRESQVSGDSEGIPENRGFGRAYVAAGQGRNAENRVSGVHPPHPPEEVDTSSPYPLTRTNSAVPSPREEGPEFSPEEIRVAETLLQQMQRFPGGAATARKCAPRLLRVTRAQGWPALDAMDDEQRALLEAEIFRNTGGAKSWVKCLPGWIDDLRLYDRARSRSSAVQAADGREMCPDHPGRYRKGCIDCAMAVPS